MSIRTAGDDDFPRNSRRVQERAMSLEPPDSLAGIGSQRGKVSRMSRDEECAVGDDRLHGRAEPFAFNLAGPKELERGLELRSYEARVLWAAAQGWPIDRG